MIEGIDLDGIRLHTRGGPRKNGERFNIFSSDTFNVIIGDNGAGKTRALKNIVAAMGYDGQALGCEVHFDDATDVVAEVAKFGVAYYTSIPYKVDLPPDGRRFKNASLPFGEDDCFGRVDVRQFADVADALNIRTRPMIAMSCNYALVLPTLGRALVRSISQGNAIPAVVHDLFPVGEMLKHSNTLLKALGLPLDHADPAEIARRRISPRIMRQARDICYVIRQLVEASAVYDPVVALSAFESVAQGTKDITALSIVFFQQVLHIPLDLVGRLYKSAAETSKRLDLVLQKKSAIFRAEGNWTHDDDGQTLSIKTEYENSNLLKNFPEDELKKFATIYWGNFSSGQLAIFYQFTALWHAARDFADRKLSKILLLVDEGDIFLHTSWQRQYVELFNDFIAKLRKEFDFERIQVILTTHSSAVVTDIPGEFIFRLDRKTRNKRNPAPVLGFAAPPQDIVNSSFSTDSIGSFAQKLLIKTAKNIKKNGGSERDKYVISLIDDPVIKREFLRLSAAYSTLQNEEE